ncbi:Glutamyl-tRNAGln amidotransferase subunit B, mitochondrial [Hondaea fermentalgiana]|uniref:Glutamyl-tRNA(Gln) amidotransferase subunit B, mitochondrial n=1 Tax=Hondaea fermentalgiana TaxID=2315210 RepID=A0A2R5GP16_9STRA|nr:Glutamyl-tRNAGln amidotransferase subunit B, mitochondrial [Hondaea fermentalgiana]|eukprot:GBG32049.1 Glutamyl-tRNAGln amidotransferase subunit B, mitochondrial [Hondaea fermentalgiana]
MASAAVAKAAQAAQATATTSWRVKVGIEIHARVLARSKLFSGASTSFAHDLANPNEQVALFDAGLPGTLPRVNAACVDQAIRTGIALRGTVHPTSIFERKHYFYGDSPLGFQITQQRHPIVSGGALHVVLKDNSKEEEAARANKRKMEEKQRKKNEKKAKKKKNAKAAQQAEKEDAAATQASVDADDGNAADNTTASIEYRSLPQCTVRITRIQLEQDTGRMLPTLDGQKQLLDLNRAGTGVMEIVTEPDMESPQEAAEFVQTMQTLLRTVGTCDGNMEDGSLRADVNVSVHAPGINSHRVEVKNLNSIRAVSRAVEVEALRLVTEYRDVEPDDLPTMARPAETRAFDALEGVSRVLRSKEGAADYRFFPDPDLPPLVIAEERISNLALTMPPLPEEILARLQGPELALSQDDALVLFHEPGGVAYFDQVCVELNKIPEVSKDGPSQAANWICSVLLGLGEMSLRETLHPAFVAGVVDMVAKEEISRLTAKKLLSESVGDLAAVDPRPIVEANAWFQINDDAVLRELAASVLGQLAATPKGRKLISDFHGGKDALKGSFIGQVMRASGQRANPRLLEPIVLDELRRFQ